MISKQEFATRVLFAKLVAIADGNFAEASAELDPIFWTNSMHAEQLPALLKSELVNNLSNWASKADLNFTAGLNENVTEWVQTQLLNFTEELKIVKKAEYQKISVKTSVHQKFLAELQNTIFTKQFARQFLTTEQKPESNLKVINEQKVEIPNVELKTPDHASPAQQQITKLTAEIEKIKNEIEAKEQPEISLSQDLPKPQILEPRQTDDSKAQQQLEITQAAIDARNALELEKVAAQESINLAKQSLKQAQDAVYVLREEAEAAKRNADATLDQIAQERSVIEQKMIAADQEIRNAYSNGTALAQRSKADVATASARVDAIFTATQRAKADLDAAHIAEVSGSGTNLSIATAEARLKAMRIAADQAQKDLQAAYDAESSVANQAAVIVDAAENRVADIHASLDGVNEDLEAAQSAALNRVHDAEDALAEAQANANASSMILQAAEAKLADLLQSDLPNQASLQFNNLNQASNAPNNLAALSPSMSSLADTNELYSLKRQLAEAESKLAAANARAQQVEGGLSEVLAKQAEAIARGVALAKRDADAAELRAAKAVAISEAAEKRAAEAIEIADKIENELIHVQSQLQEVQSRASTAEEKASTEHSRVISAQKTIKELEAQQFRLQASLAAARQAAAESKAEGYDPRLLAHADIVHAPSTTLSNRDQVQLMHKILKSEVDSSQIDQWNEEMIRLAEQAKKKSASFDTDLTPHEETVLQGGTLNSVKPHLSASELDSIDDMGSMGSIFAPAQPREKRSTQLLQSAVIRPTKVQPSNSNQLHADVSVAQNTSATIHHTPQAISPRTLITSANMQSLQKVASLKTSDFNEQAQEINLCVGTGQEIVANIEKFESSSSPVSATLEVLLINFIGSLKPRHVPKVNAEGDPSLNLTYYLLAICLRDAGLPLSIVQPLNHNIEENSLLAQIKTFLVLPANATTHDIGDRIIRYYLIGGWNVDNPEFIAFCKQLGYAEDASYILQAGLKGDKMGLLEVMHNPAVKQLEDTGDLRYYKGYGAQLGPDFQNKMLKFSQIVKEAAGTKESFIQILRKFVASGPSGDSYRAAL